MRMKIPLACGWASTNSLFSSLSQSLRRPLHRVDVLLMMNGIEMIVSFSTNFFCVPRALCIQIACLVALTQTEPVLGDLSEATSGSTRYLEATIYITAWQALAGVAKVFAMRAYIHTRAVGTQGMTTYVLFRSSLLWKYKSRNIVLGVRCHRMVM